MDEKKKYSAPAVKKALDILEMMIHHNKPYTVTELASELEISTNSTFRILKELEEKHYVNKNNTDSSYQLTSKLYYLGRSLHNRISLITESRETLDAIQRETKETVLLTMLAAHHQTMVIDQLESPLSIKFLSTVGHCYPSHSSAMGKCLLAFSEPNVLEEYLQENELNKQTANTISDPDALRKECEKIRQRGIAYDNEESTVGLTCMACPVFSAEHKLRASIGISAISFRLPPVVMLEYEEVLKQESALLSDRLGDIGSHQFPFTPC